MSFRQPYTITRTAAGSYVSGLFVAGSQLTLTIQASVQPVSGEDLKPLPEGRRLDDYVKVYTDSDLQMLQESTGKQPDRLTWRGHTYECISADVRQMGVISHFKYIFSKVSQL